MEPEKLSQCFNYCKDGDHTWEGELAANWSKTTKKYYYRDWSCPNCNEKVFGSNLKCRKCNHERPRNTDWYCQAHDSETPRCGHLNFQARTECQKCGQPRRAFHRTSLISK